MFCIFGVFIDRIFRSASVMRWLCTVTLGLILLAPSVNAQSSGDLASITHPLEGDTLIGDTATIYFSPGEADIHEWRITMGLTPESGGLIDSGVRNFHSEPWEFTSSGLPANGQSVTMRFWQRGVDSDWTSFSMVFKTARGVSIASVPASETVPVPEPKPEPKPVPVIESEPLAAAAPNLAAPNAVVPDGGIVVDITSAIPEVPASSTSSDYLSELASTRRRPTTPRTSATKRGSQVNQIAAQHRDGQTFLTWLEVSGNAGYNVYRHTAPITEANINSAELLTRKWGPLDAATSMNKHAHGLVPATYVISELGSPLSPQQGLFVHTTSTPGDWYYAVTSVTSGRENRSIVVGENSLANPVRESVSNPKPVLTVSMNNGKGRVYTQYMDYAKWNPTLNGYAYNYAITLPEGYNPKRSYPLLVRPHAYGEQFRIKNVSDYGWQVIQLFPSDPGPGQGTIHSWWFGYAAEHDYQRDGSVPRSGHVENFTEQRVMMAIKDTIADPEINVDAGLLHAYGHSMGGSGSLSYGIRYGNIFAGVYGSEPMTNYRSSPRFQEDMVKLWGNQSTNLSILNRGPYSENISRYSGTGVWDWMNHHEQLVQRRGDDMSFLMVAHGKADTVIDWETQGRPFARVLNEAKAGFSARSKAEAGHSWLGFAATNKSLFGFGHDADFSWKYPVNMSFLSVQNASGSGSMSPGLDQHDSYNMDIEWATPHTRFAKSIVDEPKRYEVSVRSTSDVQTADITPRNTQRFSVRAGEQCGWRTLYGRKVLAQGSVTADPDGLLTIADVTIRKGKGTRIVIECT